MKTYNDIRIATRNTLRDNGIETYNLEASVILSQASGKTTADLLRDGMLYASPEVERKVADYIRRRLAGEPVAYITGMWEFYGLPMYVTPDVLIPRIDTELLIDTAKEILTGKKMDARILDLCTGSGCIACAMAHEMPASKLVAVDISNAALEICRKNILLNRLTSRILTMQADAASTPPMSIGMFDMIISNPPYIPTEEIYTLDSSVKDYEPHWALDGGKDGLVFYKAIIKYWKSLLRPEGSILFEVGEGQAEDVKEMLLSAGFRSVESRIDTGSVERVVIGFV
ncbi:MAG: peptide chain release factor N(5)-glutamine methyltransferase [Oscillospiraceae bacterium]|nr:peptide chain release factor N(5)-glutamine methyltransferase [Oscillospiraceae bacterium]